MPEVMRQLVMWLLTVPPVYRWAVSVIFVAFVIALSITPGEARPGDSLFSWLVANTATPVQKTLHVAIYAILAFSWVWTLHSIESRALRFTTALVVSISLGAALEWHQTKVPGRYGTITDVLLNLVGALLGLLAAFLLL